jgi:hypothetical protein
MSDENAIILIEFLGIRHFGEKTICEAIFHIREKRSDEF